MFEVTKTLAVQDYIVGRGNETRKVQIVPQLASTLRKDLVFWEQMDDDDHRGNKRKSTYFIYL